MDIQHRVRKQPREQYAVAIDFEDRLPTGVSLSTCTVSAINLTTGQADTSVYHSSSGTISGTQAIGFLKAGTSGQKYQVTYLVTCGDSPATTFEEEILLEVEAI